MKIILLFTGKTEDNYLKEGIEKYSKRIGRYIPYEIKIINERKKKSAAGDLLTASGSYSYVVCLDEKGDKLNSSDFANFLEKIMNQGYKELVFITGGAYGFSESEKQSANKLISLSEMTFSHQMVRLFLVEQIYRAITIIRGEPYHHQ
jgi:23S rRNA (pseudouridine1915-N3)-methyltransferase